MPYFEAEKNRFRVEFPNTVILERLYRQQSYRLLIDGSSGKALKELPMDIFWVIAVIIFFNAENATVAAYQAIRLCQHVEECRLIG